MSLLKLRTTTSFLSAHRLSLSRYSKFSHNESFLKVLPSVGGKYSFHSISRNQQEHLLSPLVAPPSIGRRNFSTTDDDEPFFQMALKFLVDSPVVLEMENYIIKFHDFSGLHWWSSIVVLSFGARLIFTTPLSIYQHIVYARLDLIKEKMNPIVEKLKIEASASVNRLAVPPKQAQLNYQRRVQSEYDKLVIRYNCHPLKGTFVHYFQIPLWLFASSALRNIISGYPQDNPDVFIAVTEMVFGGPFWCTNLLAPDPTFLIPICLGLTNLVNLEMQILKRYTGTESLVRRIGVNAFRLISLCLVPIAIQMPSAIGIYWLSSSVFGLFQNALLLMPKVRQTCRIPYSKSELQHPFRHIGEKFVERNAAFKDKLGRLFKS